MNSIIYVLLLFGTSVSSGNNNNTSSTNAIDSAIVVESSKIIALIQTKNDSVYEQLLDDGHIRASGYRARLKKRFKKVATYMESKELRQYIVVTDGADYSMTRLDRFFADIGVINPNEHYHYEFTFTFKETSHNTVQLMKLHVNKNRQASIPTPPLPSANPCKKVLPLPEPRPWPPQNKLFKPQSTEPIMPSN
jgi:hypothetical protein